MPRDWLRFFAVILTSAWACFGDPRAKASDYPAHAESPKLGIGAEYLVHSFSNGKQSYFVPDYLVVDAAVYPNGAIAISQGHFKLRMNGKGILLPQSPGMVAYSLKNPDFSQRYQTVATGRAGDTGVIIGEAPAPARFPGDRRPTEGRTPPPTQAPDPAHPGALEPADEVAVRLALPEGEFHGPQSGYLYFAFDGRIKKIKSLDLIYGDESGELVLKLF